MALIITIIILTLLVLAGTISGAIYLKGGREILSYYINKDNPKDRITEREYNSLYSSQKSYYIFDENKSVVQYKGKGPKSFYLVLLSFLPLLLIFFGIFETIDMTEVVVATEFGEVKEVISKPGFKTKSPITVYHKYSTKIQEIRYDGSESDPIIFYSKDSQTVDSMLTVQWRINVEDAELIYSNFGGSVESVRLRLGSLIVEKTKSALSVYTATDLITRRSELSSVIELSITEEVLARNIPVTVVAVYLTEFSFSDAFEAAVEAKMIAEQEQLKAATEKEIAIIRAQQEAERMRIEAEANADKAKIEADAAVLRATSEAESLRIKSEAEAKAQEVLNSVAVEAIKKMYVSQFETDTERTSFETSGVGGYLTIEEIAEIVIKQLYYDAWDGKLPEVITDGAGIIINP